MCSWFSFQCFCSQREIKILSRPTSDVTAHLKNIFFLFPVMLFIHLNCFSGSFLERLAVEVSHQHNVTRWHSACAEKLGSNVSFQKS